MTTKELLYIEDALGHAQFFQTKCQETANKIQDQELRACVEQMAQKHHSLSVMTGLPRSFPGRVPQSVSGNFWKVVSLPPMWSLQKRQAMNAPSSRKSSGICITISVRTPEKPDICPACQRSKAMVSQRRPAA